MSARSILRGVGKLVCKVKQTDAAMKPHSLGCASGVAEGLVVDFNIIEMLATAFSEAGNTLCKEMVRERW